MPDTRIAWVCCHPLEGRLEDARGLVQEACRLRALLGLPSGRVLSRVSGSQCLPAVVWECGFPSLAAWRRDRARLQASPELRSIRGRLERCLTEVERTVWSVAHRDPDGATGQPFTVLNAYFPAPGRPAAVLAHRIHASEVRRALGFGYGRVLTRPPGRAGDALPTVVWQMDYLTPEARGQEGEAVMATPEFQQVMAHMRTLVARFERALYASLPLPRSGHTASTCPARMP